MRIVIVGASGTIGSAVVSTLSQHEVIKVGRTHGDYQVDMTDFVATQQLFAAIGAFDALVVASGSVTFKPLTKLTIPDWQVGLNSKLMGQINLVQAAIPYLNERSSITLTSGIISDEPIKTGVSATVVNRAVEGFAVAAACELPKGIRINVISPTMLTESTAKYASFFPGFGSVSAEKVAQAYYKSIFGIHTGKIYRVFS